MVEVLAGGGAGREQVPVIFSTSELPGAPNRAEVEIRLAPPAPLNRVEADRILRAR